MVEIVALLQALDAHTPVSQLSMGIINESFPVPSMTGSSLDGFRHAATFGLEEMLIKVVMHPIEKLATWLAIMASVYIGNNVRGRCRADQGNDRETKEYHQAYQKPRELGRV